MLAVLLGLAASLASCGSLSFRANPPADTLAVSVTVYDHESPDRTPARTTLLAVTLKNGNTVVREQTAYPTSTSTLVCDGVDMQVGGFSTSSGQQEQPDSYSGIVEPQSGSYTCTYTWVDTNQHDRIEQATLTIPVAIPLQARIESPSGLPTVSVPDPGDPGTTLTYSDAGYSAVRVTAIAEDFKGLHQAISGEYPDSGSVTISGKQFPDGFSVGWGMLVLRRSVTNQNLNQVGGNAVFKSVELMTFEQVSQIDVFWV